jgi:hypothetical protein
MLYNLLGISSNNYGILMGMYWQYNGGQWGLVMINGV